MTTIGDRLKQARIAAGKSVDEIVNRAYLSSVPLGRDRSNKNRRSFHYKTTPSLRREVLEYIEMNLDVFEAQHIINYEPLHRSLNNRSLALDLPLFSGKNAGSIVSACYADPVKIKGEMLQTLFSLKIASDILMPEKSQLSILRPGEKSGLTKSTFKKVDAEISKQVDQFRNFNIEIIESSDIESLSEQTCQWWKDAA